MAYLIIAARAKVKVGEGKRLRGNSPHGRFSAVFEDDGANAYFYAMDGDQICDAVHVYDVSRIVKNWTNEIEIGWSEDGLKCALSINGVPDTVFDFSECRSYCHSNLPPAVGNWTKVINDWDRDPLRLFK